MRFILAAMLLVLLPASGFAASKSPLDNLFAQLARASSPEEAKPIEDQIEARFLQSGSPGVDLLMSRASQPGSDNATAMKLLQAVTHVAPHYAEAWHRMGELEAASGNDARAMIALQKTILLNPRQFTALNELGAMLERYGDKQGALKLYRRARALDPQMNSAAHYLDALTRAVEGQGI